MVPQEFSDRWFFISNSDKEKDNKYTVVIKIIGIALYALSPLSLITTI